MLMSTSVTSFQTSPILICNDSTSFQASPILIWKFIVAGADGDILSDGLTEGDIEGLNDGLLEGDIEGLKLLEIEGLNDVLVD